MKLAVIVCGLQFGLGQRILEEPQDVSIAPVAPDSSDLENAGLSSTHFGNDLMIEHKRDTNDKEIEEKKGGGGGHGGGFGGGRGGSGSSSGGKGGSGSNSGGKGGSGSNSGGKGGSANVGYGRNPRPDYSKDPPPPYSSRPDGPPPPYHAGTYGQRGPSPRYWNGQYYPYGAYGYHGFLPFFALTPFFLAGPYGAYGHYCHGDSSTNCSTNTFYVNGTRTTNSTSKRDDSEVFTNGTYIVLDWQNGTYEVRSHEGGTFTGHSVDDDLAVNGTYEPPSGSDDSSWTQKTINPNYTSNGTELKDPDEDGSDANQAVRSTTNPSAFLVAAVGFTAALCL